MSDSPPRAGVLRTPESRFEKLIGFPWSPRYVELEPGVRMAYVDIGFGRSDMPTDPEAYTYSQHVAWVTSLIEIPDLRGVTLFGQDWGGLIGTRVAASHFSQGDVGGELAAEIVAFVRRFPA